MEKVKRTLSDKLTKTPGTLANTTETPVLNWEVFMTPDIPIVTPDRPPGVQETYFQAMASTSYMG